MRVIVFGATGGVGRLVVEQALGAGHIVTAVVRDPTTYTFRHALLTVVRGDVMDAATLDAPMTGQQAVFSALGSKGNGKTTVYSVGTANIINAMDTHKVKRLIAVTSVGVEAQDPSFGFIYGTIMRRLFIKNFYADMRRMETVVRASDTDWTLVRPSRLTDDPGRGSYRTSTGKMPPKGMKIARADVAHVMLECLDEKRYIRQHVALGY